jgi:branched-chain amino acid transport system permease protein
VAERPIRALLLASGGIYVLLLLFGQFSTAQVFVVSEVVIYSIAAIGQDWLLGRAGLVSLGGAGFMAIGAFTVAVTTGTPFSSWPIQLILAGVIAAAAGLIVGLSSIRLNGLYLLLATLAFGYVVDYFTQIIQGSRATGYTIPAPHIGSFAISSARGLLLFGLIILAIVVFFSVSLQRGAPGRYWRAIHESDLATISLGIDTTRWRLLAFVGSSVLTAISGVLFAWIVGLVDFNTFDLTLGLNLVIMVFLGGSGTVLGPIIGAILVVEFPQVLNTLSTSLPQTGSLAIWLGTNEAILVSAVFGLALLVVIVIEPRGIMGVIDLAEGRVRRLTRRRTKLGQEPVGGATPTGLLVTPQPTIQLADAGRVSSEPQGDAPLLRVEHLSVRYRNGSVGLESASFDVGTGSIVAIVGRNGAGKTSTLRGIAGFPSIDRADVRGVLEFHGVTVKRHDPKSMRRRGLVLVPERDKVFPSLTVTEHLKLAGARAAEIEAIYERSPLLKRISSRRAGLLSGGERQLVALAAATASKPSLLLIDEPCLGLAPVAINEVMSELRRLRDEMGMTILLAEQAIDFLEQVMDRYYFLDAGRIAGTGGKEDLQVESIRQTLMGI